jgi:glycosyltransferase involved in cell wall biosynthesis
MQNKKIKILYTIPNFDTAGSGKVLYDLARGLNKAYFEVHIACSHSRGSFFQEVEKLGLPMHLLETTVPYRPYWSLLVRTRPYKNFIKQHQFDIVHSWHWSSDWTEAWAAKQGGALFVFTKKAMTWGNRHWKIRSRMADFIITINEEMNSFFPKKKNQQLIPLGLDTAYYSRKHFPEREKNKIFRVITVANLVPVKGIEVLIEAILSLNNPQIQLDILGDDRSDYATTLKRKVESAEATQQIRFLGKHKDVRPFLAASDLYVIPTLNEGRKEGMPMALVEAMSMEVPVLGSDISGINFVLKDFKEWLFTAQNSQQLATKIEQIFGLPETERKKIGQALGHYVREHFSLEKFITAHENLYRSLVAKKKGEERGSKT